MRVGQPGMHRPHRHLDREGEKERHEKQHLRLERQRQLVPLENRKASAADRVEVNQRHQHQDRAEKCVQKKLDRGVNAVRAAPDADDQIHRDQHPLEEDVEQHAVERGEDAIKKPRHDQEGRHVLRNLFLDHDPARPDHEHRDKAVEKHQQHRDAVDAEKIVDVEAGNPLLGLDELHFGSADCEVGVKRNRHGEAGDRSDERQPARSGNIAVAMDREHQHS